MHAVDVLLLGLIAVAALATPARRLGVPYPLLLLLGGVAFALMPGLPRVTADPEVVFALFVPPIVFSASWETSWRDVRNNVGPIALLAFGLVLATMAAVAVVAHFTVPGMTWAAAFVLGAVVSPTDTVAVGAIASRLGLSRRLVTILEGESNLNDAVSLVAFRVAVAAVVSGSFSLPLAAGEVVIDGIGGVAIGLGVVWLYQQVERRIDAPEVEVTLTLLLPYAAFIPAERFGLSGVTAVVATGIAAGRFYPRLTTALGRLRVRAFWNVLVFLLHGLIFILLGLQLPAIVDAVDAVPLSDLAGYAAAIVLAVVVVRIVWVVPTTLAWLSRRGMPTAEGPDRGEARRASAVIAWAGLRGADTLVVALALPLTLGDGSPFPDRALLLFLTLCVILATLFGQGLSLPWLIRRLGLAGDDRHEQEVVRTRIAAAEAAIGRLDELAAGNGQVKELTDRLRGRYEERTRRYDARQRGSPDAATEALAAARGELVQDILSAQRRALIELRDRGEIGDHALREVLTELDLEGLRLAAEPPQSAARAAS